MTLTRDFKITVHARAARDIPFAAELARTAAELSEAGEPELAARAQTLGRIAGAVSPAPDEGSTGCEVTNQSATK